MRDVAITIGACMTIIKGNFCFVYFNMLRKFWSSVSVRGSNDLFHSYDILSQCSLVVAYSLIFPRIQYMFDSTREQAYRLCLFLVTPASSSERCSLLVKLMPAEF